MKWKQINWENTAMKLAGTLVGVAVGGATKKALNESKAVEGLAGEGKNYLVPVVLAVGGAVMSASVNNEFLKNAGFGVTAVGGASIVNELAGKEVITLNGVSGVRGIRGIGRIPRRIPNQGVSRGVGNPSYNAGMGTFNAGMGSFVGCF